MLTSFVNVYDSTNKNKRVSCLQASILILLAECIILQKPRGKYLFPVINTKSDDCWPHKMYLETTDSNNMRIKIRRKITVANGWSYCQKTISNTQQSFLSAAANSCRIARARKPEVSRSWTTNQRALKFSFHKIRERWYRLIAHPCSLCFLLVSSDLFVLRFRSNISDTVLSVTDSNTAFLCFVI